MQKQKVLIIKTGYSEILDKDHSKIVSFGDILRTTVILHKYKNDEVIWVTDEKALPLLENNPYIKKLLIYDSSTILQLESEEFDIVINLEKVPGICALADKIKAWKKYGFRFNTRTGEAEAYDLAFDVLAVSSNPKSKKENEKLAQELLFEMVGSKWSNENYILGYKPKSQKIYDIGLNTIAGVKWPTKSWPIEYWDKVEEILERDGIKTTRQDKQNKQILENLYDYMDWINSCRVLVTNDSLGLHIALALEIPVIGIFGPTPFKEVYFYDKGKAIFPENNFECMPCFACECDTKKYCMHTINPEKVYHEIKEILKSKNLECTTP